MGGGWVEDGWVGGWVALIVIGRSYLVVLRPHPGKQNLEHLHQLLQAPRNPLIGHERHDDARLARGEGLEQVIDQILKPPQQRRRRRRRRRGAREEEVRRQWSERVCLRFGTAVPRKHPVMCQHH